MHHNERFNILQTGTTFNIKWVVIDGQRTASGGMATGAKIISPEMSREDAIALADHLQSKVE